MENKQRSSKAGKRPVINRNISCPYHNEYKYACYHNPEGGQVCPSLNVICECTPQVENVVQNDCSEIQTRFNEEHYHMEECDSNLDECTYISEDFFSYSECRQSFENVKDDSDENITPVPCTHYTHQPCCSYIPVRRSLKYRCPIHSPKRTFSNGLDSSCDVFVPPHTQLPPCRERCNTIAPQQTTVQKICFKDKYYSKKKVNVSTNKSKPKKTGTVIYTRTTTGPDLNNNRSRNVKSTLPIISPIAQLESNITSSEDQPTVKHSITVIETFEITNIEDKYSTKNTSETIITSESKANVIRASQSEHPIREHETSVGKSNQADTRLRESKFSQEAEEIFKTVPMEGSINYRETSKEIFDAVLLPGAILKATSQDYAGSTNVKSQSSESQTSVRTKKILTQNKRRTITPKNVIPPTTSSRSSKNSSVYTSKTNSRSTGYGSISSSKNSTKVSLVSNKNRPSQTRASSLIKNVENSQKNNILQQILESKTSTVIKTSNNEIRQESALEITSVHNITKSSIDSNNKSRTFESTTRNVSPLMPLPPKTPSKSNVDQPPPTKSVTVMESEKNVTSESKSNVANAKLSSEFIKTMQSEKSMQTDESVFVKSISTPSDIKSTVDVFSQTAEETFKPVQTSSSAIPEKAVKESKTSVPTPTLLVFPNTRGWSSKTSSIPTTEVSSQSSKNRSVSSSKKINELLIQPDDDTRTSAVLKNSDNLVLQPVRENKSAAAENSSLIESYPESIVKTSLIYTKTTTTTDPDNRSRTIESTVQHVSSIVPLSPSMSDAEQLATTKSVEIANVDDKMTDLEKLSDEIVNKFTSESKSNVANAYLSSGSIKTQQSERSTQTDESVVVKSISTSTDLKSTADVFSQTAEDAFKPVQTSSYEYNDLPHTPSIVELEHVATYSQRVTPGSTLPQELNESLPNKGPQDESSKTSVKTQKLVSTMPEKDVKESKTIVPTPTLLVSPHTHGRSSRTSSGGVSKVSSRRLKNGSVSSSKKFNKLLMQPDNDTRTSAVLKDSDNLVLQPVLENKSAAAENSSLKESFPEPIVETSLIYTKTTTTTDPDNRLRTIESTTQIVSSIMLLSSNLDADQSPATKSVTVMESVEIKNVDDKMTDLEKISDETVKKVTSESKSNIANAYLSSEFIKSLQSEHSTQTDESVFVKSISTPSDIKSTADIFSQTEEETFKSVQTGSFENNDKDIPRTPSMGDLERETTQSQRIAAEPTLPQEVDESLAIKQPQVVPLKANVETQMSSLSIISEKGVKESKTIAQTPTLLVSPRTRGRSFRASSHRVSKVSLRNGSTTSSKKYKYPQKNISHTSKISQTLSVTQHDPVYKNLTLDKSTGVDSNQEFPLHKTPTIVISKETQTMEDNMTMAPSPEPTPFILQPPVSKKILESFESKPHEDFLCQACGGKCCNCPNFRDILMKLAELVTPPPILLENVGSKSVAVQTSDTSTFHPSSIAKNIQTYSSS